MCDSLASRFCFARAALLGVLLFTAVPTTSSFSLSELLQYHDVVHHAVNKVNHHAVTYHAASAPSIAFVVKHQVESAMQSYTQLLHTHPLVTKMATGGTLATTGDAIAQKAAAEKAKRDGEIPAPYDKRRAASFTMFDMAYRALQHVAYPAIVAACHGQFLGPLIPHALSSAADMDAVQVAAAMEQTLASQLGIVPFLYYPVFFTLTGFMQGLTSQAAWERAQQTFIPLMKRNLAFWIPVQFVQFAYIDEQLQIPFLSAAGLCWTFILSLSAGSAKSYNAQGEEELALAAAQEALEEASLAVLESTEPSVAAVQVVMDEQAQSTAPAMAYSE